MKITIIAVVIVALLSSTATFFVTRQFMSGSEAGTKINVVSATGNSTLDKDFIGNLVAYINLLDNNEYEQYWESISQIDEDQALQEEMSALTLGFLFEKKPELKAMIEELQRKVNDSKTEEKYFEQNTACAALVPGINANLETSIKTFISTETREIETMFYSPVLETCVYVVNSTTIENNPYKTIVRKQVYNGNSQSLIQTYYIYSSDDYENEAQGNRSEDEKRNFVKFILENSNYNVELLKDSDFIYI